MKRWEVLRSSMQERGAILGELADCTPKGLLVGSSFIEKVCLCARDTAGFDYLACISATDEGEKVGTLSLYYHLYSMYYAESMCLKVCLGRKPLADKQDSTSLPSVASITKIYPGANWHEREAFDLMGIYFEGHPHLRRILLPEDWQGHPLRKDYESDTHYQGIPMKRDA